MGNCSVCLRGVLAARARGNGFFYDESFGADVDILRDKRSLARWLK